MPVGRDRDQLPAGRQHRINPFEPVADFIRRNMLENVVPVDEAPGAVGQRTLALKEVAQVKTARMLGADLRDGLRPHGRGDFDPGDGKTGVGNRLQERSRAVSDLKEAGRLPPPPLPPQEIDDKPSAAGSCPCRAADRCFPERARICVAESYACRVTRPAPQNPSPPQ